jgi:hypothetical protein
MEQYSHTHTHTHTHTHKQLMVPYRSHGLSCKHVLGTWPIVGVGVGFPLSI